MRGANVSGEETEMHRDVTMVQVEEFETFCEGSLFAS